MYRYNQCQREAQGEDPRFSLKILGFYRRPLQRQTMEGLLIGEAKEGTFMNQRGEWVQNLPPKLEVVDPDEEFRPQEEKKTKRKSKNQSPTSREDPINQQTKRQKIGTMNTDENDKEQIATRARNKAKADLSTFGGYEEGELWNLCLGTHFGAKKETL